MSRQIRGTDLGGLAGLHRDVRRQLRRDVGPRSRPLAAAGRVLLAAVRAEINTPGTPSNPAAPGEPPHRITRELQRSWGNRAIGDARRVGSSWFVARLLEDGSEVHAPHPYARTALPKVEDAMTDAFLTELAKLSAAPGGPTTGGG